MRVLASLASMLLFLPVPSRAALPSRSVPGAPAAASSTPLPVLATPGTRAVVLFFVASDCPISNRTLPEMRRVRDHFAGSPVRFWFVYPNTGETPAGVRAHWASFGSGAFATQVLLDPSGALTRMAGARATPEAVVLEPAHNGWQPVYAGRVDDRYVRLGLERPQATEHIAERVVDEVLHGQPVEAPTGALVGCGIMNPGAVTTGAGTP